LRVNDSDEPSFDPEIEMTLSEGVHLSKMLECFEYFLKACGYYVDGELTIIKEEDDEDIISEG
jgi:hypothetical protein